MTELPSDMLAMRDYIYSLMDLEGVRSVLDLGCGKGYDLRRIGETVGPDVRLVGVDSSQKALDAAKAEVGDDPRFEYMVADVSQGLPFGDGRFDLVYSRDMLECIPDKDALIREVHRVLGPHGRVLFAHWDWDSQAIDGSDKDLVRKIIHIFGDWKQAWMADCDSWMGRRLWGAFHRGRLFEGKVYPYVLTSTEFDHSGMRDFEALVKRGMITREEYDRFLGDLQSLADKGEYFHAITSYIYVGRKLEQDGSLVLE